jgi:hypothetical protein
LNGQRSTLAECEIWLCRMWFPWSFSFIFLSLHFQKGMDVLFSATGITSFRSLELTLCTKHRLNVKSTNYLQFTPFCIFHPKVPSKHKTKNFKVFYRYNIGKTLVKCGWNYRIIWLHQKFMWNVQNICFKCIYLP